MCLKPQVFRMKWACAICHLLTVRFYNIFSRFLINGTIFEKKIIELKTCVLIFSKIVYGLFDILSKICRDKMVNVYWSSCEVTVIFVRFQFSGNIFEKFSNVTKNPSTGSRVPCVGRRDERTTGGRTDRQTWQSLWSLFAILRTRLRIYLPGTIVIIFKWPPCHTCSSTDISSSDWK
jgi:hypothetical protein